MRANRNTAISQLSPAHAACQTAQALDGQLVVLGRFIRETRLQDRGIRFGHGPAFEYLLPDLFVPSRTSYRTPSEIVTGFAECGLQIL